MSIEDVIHQMNELIREKEAQLQTMLRLVHSERCMREEILAFFGEACGHETEVLLFGLRNGWMVYWLDAQKPTLSINECWIGRKDLRDSLDNGTVLTWFCRSIAA